VPASAKPSIADLRDRIRRMENGAVHNWPALPFGIEEIDRRPPGGGLALGCLHEVAGGGSGTIDGAAAAAFAVGIAARTEGQVMWCLVVPTLLTWPGSAIIHDIKGENWHVTAGFRAQYGKVLRFDPTDISSAAYNPLLEIRQGEWEVRDVQNVADVLVDPEGSLERRSHWEKTSHSLLVGAILHVLYAEADKTLAGVANFLSDPKRSLSATMAAMMTTPHLGEAGPHPVIASAARELLNKSDNERSGVLPEQVAAAAKASATERYDQFMETLGQRLAGNAKSLSNLTSGSADGH